MAGVEAGKTLVHGTCLDLSGAGVLIRGPSGAGKSDLALRLMHLGPSPLLAVEAGMTLVGDDYVEIEAEAGEVMAIAPEAIAGRMEVRGVGVIAVDHVARTRLKLVVDIADRETIERVPDADQCSIELVGIAVARIALDARDASAPYKVLAGLNLALGSAAAGRRDAMT